MRLRILGGAVAVATMAMLLAIAEVAVRVLDGLPLTTLTLRSPPVRLAAGNRDLADLRHVSAVPLAKGVEPTWYSHDPPPLSRKPVTKDIEERFATYQTIDPIGAFFAWNRVYLREQLCAGSKLGALGLLDDFYVFDPPGETPFPIYRHLSNINPPGWFVTSNFGWRGPDVPLNKPTNTIRIAFVGSSTTVDPYGAPFSHIELIGEWLNLWIAARGWPYRAEVINAARTGIDARSIAAIVEQELAPLEPDLVVYDDANDFKPGLQFTMPKSGAPPADPPVAWPIERVSALARRLHVVARRAENGEEPRKPAIQLQWPEGVSEDHPDVSSPRLPMDLATVLSAFERIRLALEPTGGVLAPTSAIALVHDGMRLQLPRDQGVFDFLNRLNYPLTYAQTRRLKDFQNRVYRQYAAAHDLPFVDKAAVFPADPELFADMVHNTPPGLRLKAWIYLQWLATWIDHEISAKHLPRPMVHPAERHPNFQGQPYPIVTRAQVMATCRP